MDRAISMRNARERIQDVDLVSSGGIRLGSSETKVIPTGRSRLLKERR